MLRWLMIGAVVWVGCAEAPAPKSSGASHWLQPCADDAECGAASSCLCGRCSAICDADSDACGDGECVADACDGAAVCRPLEIAEVEPGAELDVSEGLRLHRDSLVDGNVLELRADGTFIFTLGGCDAVECAWGHWDFVVGGIELRPPEGEPGFRWPDEFALDTVSGVLLSQREGRFVARVTAPDREAFEQDWLERGLTVDCVDWSVSLSDESADPGQCQSPAYPD